MHKLKFHFPQIFHPNVASSGEICVNTLKKDWKSDLGIKHVLLVSEARINLTLLDANRSSIFRQLNAC